MFDKFQFSDDQTLTNLDTTGEISDHFYDVEENANTDMQLVGVLNVVIISATLTSGLTYGMVIGLRVDDTETLDTAQDGSSAGYKDIAMKHILKEEIVAGRAFSIPVVEDVLTRGKFVGAWYKAATKADLTESALTGNIEVESWFEDAPISKMNIQKKPT